MSDKPVIAATIGDPCGIGPEVCVKALATGEVHELCRPLLIGSTEAVEDAVRFTGVNLGVRRVTEVNGAGSDPSVIDVYDTGELDPADITPAQANATCGKASVTWLNQAHEMTERGLVNGTIMGPINTDAIGQAGLLDEVLSIEPGKTYLTLLTGPLRIVHLTDHIPLRQVCDVVSKDLVHSALRMIHESFSRWGVKDPRIVVAGLNAHAYGDEDKNEIAPGVEAARAEGIDVTGPSSPDSVFRWCIEGKYDGVLAMYHDQGHIAVKTWRFEGNCALILGMPGIHASIAHGTAFDIVGKNLASHEMMLEAMKQTASLGGGRGFLPV